MVNSGRIGKLRSLIRSTFRADPELTRLAIALNDASLMRLWIISRDVTRRSKGSGKVAKSALRAVLRRLNIAYSKSHFYRLLNAGNGFYWDISGSFLYIKSYQRVATRLSLLAEQKDPYLVATNRPGVADVYVNVLGTLEQFEANCYSSWLYYRDHPQISREQLSILFSRTAETIRRWEEKRLAQTVTKRSNYAQCGNVNDYPYPIPIYANAYVAKVGKQRVMRLRWQLPNTYFTRGIKQHRHRGQSSKVRRFVNHELQQPANLWRGGLLRCKLYFDSSSRLKSYLEKHGGVGYLWLDENRHGHGVFEVTTSGITETHAHERDSFPAERDFIQREGLKLSV